MAGRDHWLSVARSDNPDDIREHILTGFKSGKTFTPYIPTLPLPADVDRVLDFGCGLGRSFPFLRTISRHLTGFDLPPMIAQCRTLAPERADALEDDWENIRGRQYDLIFAVLVLQHVEPPVCRAYLEDFARMAPSVYVLSRAHSDFGTNVFAEIAATGVFDAAACVEVEHDPETNQLRVLGRHTCAAAADPSARGHYEVLLHSKL